MKVTVELPQVAGCAVESCAFNKEKSCHARAITVGDVDRPGCDTYFKSEGTHRETETIAGVGACKVSICRYNNDLECGAKEIQVGYSGNEALCLTFAKRQMAV